VVISKSGLEKKSSLKRRIRMYLKLLSIPILLFVCLFVSLTEFLGEYWVGVPWLFILKRTIGQLVHLENKNCPSHLHSYPAQMKRLNEEGE
jgi:hypothetical protein